MRFKTIKNTALRSGLALALLMGSGAVLAQQQINLTTAPVSATLPDGSVIPMWGYTCGAPAGGSATCAALNPAIQAANAAAIAAGGTPGVSTLWSPVVITVPTGQGLTISLTNTLSFTNSNSVPTSIVIVGQIPGGGLGDVTQRTTTPSPDHSNAQQVTWPIATPGAANQPPAQGARVQSFSTEVAAGTTQSLTWTALRPGTYLIESGTHPSIQGPMGLYGILVVTDATTGTAYGAAGKTNAVNYNAELSLLLSEIDPVQNEAVNTAVNTAGFSETAVWSGQLSQCGDPAVHSCYPPTVNYTPLYYLFNGVAFDKTNASKSLFAAVPTVTAVPGDRATGTISGNLLVRLVNAGLRMHVPSIVNSTTGKTSTPGMSLIAEDGNVLPGLLRVQSEVFMAAGKTTDVLINVPSGTSALPIYDRELSLSGNSVTRDAGMLAYISVNGATVPGAAALSTGATAADDTYNALLACPSTATTCPAIVVSDLSKGVIANDTNVNGVTLLAAPTKGTVVLNRDGTFTYTPNAGAPASDTFTYCANGTVSSGGCSSGIWATVTLGGAPIEAASGITMGDMTFTSSVGAGTAPARFAMPGVLGLASDAAGYPLTVDASTVATATTALAVNVNPDGSFTASAANAGTYTFTFKAKNSQGTQSANAATVTVIFPAASGLSVSVVDGTDHKTQIPDYRWIIEEDRTFYVDPKCTSNPLPAGCPSLASNSAAQINYGTNFHTSYMPVVAAGCTGPLSCESGQMLGGVGAVCDISNGQCHTDASQQTATYPSQVPLDPTKRYYISVLPGDAANPFVGANFSAPTNCAQGAYNSDNTLNTSCGHGMGGAPIPAICAIGTAATCAATYAGIYTQTTPLTVLTVPTPLPTAKLSVFVYQDDYPLNGEHGPGGGIDVLAPNEPGLGGFQITIFDQAGGTGDTTGQPTYDMFNQPLTNSLAGTIDPINGLDACPISQAVTANMLQAGKNATADQCSQDPTQKSCQKGVVGMIITCPKFESDGRTLSPMAGQAVVNNLYAGRYGVAATAGADRIALGEEWVQTNTLDGQKAHDSFMRVGEPGYFQEFGPAGYHVSIGFANPKAINERRFNASGSGMCQQPSANGTTGGGGLNCIHEVKGHVTTSRLSRTPDQRLFGSGDRSGLAFTQCYISLGDPDGATIAFTKCDADGNFDFTNIPAGNWQLTTFDQWNDQIVDGITQGVGLGCNSNASGLCDATKANSTAQHVDMGEIAVHQWQANIYTRTFIDMANTGVSDDSKPGLPLAATNVRFRDGSYSNFNNTDLNGFAGFNEVFPLFNWYVIETDSTRYKTTGVHVVYDAGGAADGTSPAGKPCDKTQEPTTTNPCGNSNIGAHLANTYEQYPLPDDLSVPGAVYCPEGADCADSAQMFANGNYQKSSTTNHSTGRIDPPFWFGSYGWQGFIGQGSFLEWGKKPFASGETGGIHGHVVYASTRPFDSPQLLLQLSWEPLVPHVRVNLYKESVAPDGVTTTLTLVDQTDTSSFDDWAQGFRSDGKTPNINCPGQPTTTDPFWYGLQGQPQYLDWYNSQHGGPAPTTLPHGSQYKCYDGMHNWNQLQPAPYDGMYSFPSVTSLDPVTGRPTGTNCLACVTNPDATDPYRNGTPMLPAGKYVVEVVVPPGYELVKEEDKNILIGDNYIAPAVVQFPGVGGSIFILPDQASIASQYNANNAQNSTTGLGRIANLPSHEGDTGSDETFWPCVGTPRKVPDYISLFPQSQEVAPFAGATRNLCDRKEVLLTDQSSALVKFYIFSSTHVASHFTGIILDDFTAEFDPFSPQFGEKFAPSYLPVGIKDWTGNEVNRVYADQFGLYNGLNYSTWEVNPPNPTGYGPTMMVMCMNDAGLGSTPDPLFQPAYSQFCYELPFMPGQTGYFDTPVVPTSAFSEGYNHPDCTYPDATPAVSSVTGEVAGPWLSAMGPTHTLTINALGDQSVDWYGYTGPWITKAPFNQQKIPRHYGFGATQGTGSVTIGGVNATVSGWSDTQITVTLPLNSNVPTCAVQQQSLYGGSTARCGELVITTNAGKQSVDTVTVTIGGKTPLVLAAGQTIQSAIDAAKPGDMIIVPPGQYDEMVVMWKPIRLQGVGAASSLIDANTHPAGKLLDPWRRKMVCLFGLTADGRPRDASDTACASGWTSATSGPDPSGAFTNFAPMLVDRLPFEATLGWDATLNGNLAEQLSEPSLMGAYEGAAITVAGKGVKFPAGTLVADAFGATTGAAYPNNTVLLLPADCLTGNGVRQRNPYPTNFYCNPSSIDGLGIRNSSQGGGGIFVHAYGHNLQIANNRIQNNTGTLSGGITIGQGEHPDVALAGVVPITFPTSCEIDQPNRPNTGLPFCFNMRVNMHNNAVVGNSSMGDELFSSTPAGAGGVSVNTGADYYQFTNNWVCGNVSTGDGGGYAHIGFTKNGDIEHNTIIFNQSTNPTISTNGGGLLVMGAPDADPTTCGVTTDQDCLPPPGTITPSDGSGPGLKINANLIMGNAADSGSGGGLRLQHVNGTDVLNFPNGSGNSGCRADLSSCEWNSVNVTNNIIVNNVAGWDGGGVSLLDALAVNIVNNTIASNDSTASSGTLFQSLFAPLASAPGTICTQSNGSQSCPQVSGLVSLTNSPVLQANISGLSGNPNNNPFRCPNGHGSGAGPNATCFKYSVPVLFNDAIWQNRSFFIGVSAPQSGLLGQQNTVGLFNAFTNTAAATQTSTGACPKVATGATSDPSYWEVGVRGDTGPGNHTGGLLSPMYSALTDVSDYNTVALHNTGSNPAFTSQYCNGSRTPPELGEAGWAVPPGTNETNALPNPIFTLAPAAVVDEGNNWINLRWGPLALSNPKTGAVLANYALSAGSPAIDIGGTTTGTNGVTPPGTDFFGNSRPSGQGFDIGAVEFQIPPIRTATVSPTSLAFGNLVAGRTSTAMTVTVTNTGNQSLLGGIFTVSAPFARAAGGGGGTCGATLAVNTSCTYNAVFSPPGSAAQGAQFNGTLTVAYSNATVTGSPVQLSGTAVKMAVEPAALVFGNVSPGTTSPAQTLTVTNGTGATRSLAITITAPFSRPAGGAGGNCNTALGLQNNATCTINIVFSPPANAAQGTKYNGTVTITTNGGFQVANSPVALSGTAQTLVSATLAPDPWSPATTNGCTLFACPTQAFTLTNTGNVTLTGIAKGALSGATEFTVIPLFSTCGPAGNGQFVGTTTLTAGQSCMVTVRFAPPANDTTGAKTTTLSVNAGAFGATSAGTQISHLNGTAN